MRRAELEEFLSSSLDDDRLSRGERQVFKELLDDLSPDVHEQQVLLHRAFELARERLHDGRDRALLEWIEEVVKVLRPAAGRPEGGGPLAGLRQAEAWFTPSERALSRLCSLLANCRKSIELCMFTITHDQLAEALLAAWTRRVKVRIVTDDQKSHDLGSDVHRLQRAGVEIRMDNSPAHMHNKFAILDAELLVTGSFNWTRSAVSMNQESFLVTPDPVLVQAHHKEFERLWTRFSNLS